LRDFIAEGFVRMELKIRTLKFKDRKFDNWFTEIEDRWNYEDFLKDEGWRKDWISFDCLCYYADNDTVYAGITSFDADIFWGYSRGEKRFVSTGYERIADKYDAKFHRSLICYEGYIYGAVALLHDVDRWLEAPGGAIIQYNPTTGEISKLGIPLEHHYIQAIAIDEQRGIIYGQTFTPEHLFSFDIESGKVKDLGVIGSGMAMGQGENLVLDEDGNVWGSWSVTRAWQSNPGVDSFRLFKYCVDKGKIEYFKTGLPKSDGSYGNEKAEAFFNLGNGCIYASGGNGSLYRIDIHTGKAEYLFTPIADRRSRLSDLSMGTAGYAYGIVGREGKCELLKFNPANEEYELLGKIISDEGETCWQIHDIEITPDGVIYAGENDVPHRSGYLWEIEMET